MLTPPLFPMCWKTSKLWKSRVLPKADGVPSTPGLRISGVGTLPLPLLLPELAQQITSLATKSPFGKGPDTLVDESVRKSWQIDPAKVSFDNPLFHDAIQTLAQNAAIGVPEEVGVEAILYKMLMYEPGGFFKKHRDTEKEDGMFVRGRSKWEKSFRSSSFPF